MRIHRWLLVIPVLLTSAVLIGCDDSETESNDGEQPPATRDGVDNDDDGTIDEPDETST